ncbi:MAG TPA: peptidylprolyl isomerase, partial [Candidatus Limnocylindrales bacterium]|nr:peptidylprolyl isomerase [Candidatus Limnocylindrales bacterium]
PLAARGDIDVLVAGGVIKFGSASPSSAINGQVSLAPGGSPAPGSSVAPVGARGTNCPTAEPPAATAGQTRVVTIETAKGSIAITVDPSLGPKAAGNFIALASCGFYDGLVFHRLVPGFVIQGGDPAGTGAGGPGYEFADDPVNVPYARGVVAMANSGPDTNGSQFFIVLDDNTGLKPNYSVFGRVTAGMDVVDAIASMPNAGGQTNAALDPVAMTKLTVGPPVAAIPSAAGSSTPASSPAPS